MTQENNLEIVEKEEESELKGNLEKLGVPPEATNNVITFLSSRYSGPLPPSQHFASYERTLPGTAERIVSFMEKEQTHRHELETRSWILKEKETLRGQLMALAIALLLVAGAITSSVLGQQVIAALFLGSAALGVVKHLIDGRKH